MYVLLQVLDPTGFDGVLLGIVRLAELILDEELAVDLINCFALFFLCIITTEGGWCTMVTDEVTVAVRELPFAAETVDVNLMRLESIENLCAGKSIS